MFREETNFDSASVARAENVAPGDLSIMPLKEHLVDSTGKDPKEVTNLLLKELETRPLDVETNIRLLRHLLEHKNVKEAYTHAVDVEQKTPAELTEHLAWYETLTLVLTAYRKSSNIHTWDFWMMNVSVWDKVVTLSLNERTRAIDCAPLILKLDEALRLASDKPTHSDHKQLNQEFWRHYTGQLCWHLTNFLYKQVRNKLVKNREATAIGIPLLFASYNFRPADLQGLWLEHASAQCRSQMQRWNREGASRCSQAGCMLRIKSQKRKTFVLEMATQGTKGMWRLKTFRSLFVMREVRTRAKTAFFVVTDHLLDVIIRLPNEDELLDYTRTAQLVYPDSLHHQIWLGMGVGMVDFDCASFAGLPYTMKNLKNCAAETLNILDIQSFIYAAILCHKTQTGNENLVTYSHPETSALMPAACTDLMGSESQRKWLKYAYLMFTNKYPADVSEMRVTLVRGIETIRCSGNHGLDPVLLVQLAHIFSQRAGKVTSRSEVKANEARAELYWSTSIHLLEKFKNNEAISYARDRIFDCKFQPLTRDQLLQAIIDGKLSPPYCEARPDKILVKTGEEDEVVLYSQRAKLYRHVTGEWKERGTGDIKILFNEREKKLRVLMRREQTHTICLNHVLSSTVQYTVNDERSWLFYAPDISEGELDYSIFCLCFRNFEQAAQFLVAAKAALESEEGGETTSSNANVGLLIAACIAFIGVVAILLKSIY